MLLIWAHPAHSYRQPIYYTFLKISISISFWNYFISHETSIGMEKRPFNRPEGMRKSCSTEPADESAMGMVKAFRMDWFCMEMNNEPTIEHQSATVKHFCFNIENAGLYYRKRILINYQRRCKLQSNVRKSPFSVNLYIKVRSVSVWSVSECQTAGMPIMSHCQMTVSRMPTMQHCGHRLLFSVVGIPPGRQSG